MPAPGSPARCGQQAPTCSPAARHVEGCSGGDTFTRRRFYCCSESFGNAAIEGEGGVAAEGPREQALDQTRSGDGSAPSSSDIRHRTTGSRAIVHPRRSKFCSPSMGRTAWPAPPSAVPPPPLVRSLEAECFAARHRREPSSPGKIQQSAACPRLQLVRAVFRPKRRTLLRSINGRTLRGTWR
jgi:hypothetical protein